MTAHQRRETSDQRRDQLERAIVAHVLANRRAIETARGPLYLCEPTRLLLDIILERTASAQADLVTTAGIAVDADPELRFGSPRGNDVVALAISVAQMRLQDLTSIGSLESIIRELSRPRARSAA